MKNYKRTKNLHCIIKIVSPLAIKFLQVLYKFGKKLQKTTFLNIVYHKHFELYDLFEGISNKLMIYLLFI